MISGTETIEETVEETFEDTQTRYVPMWKVLLHNDDVTTMEFVIFILMEVFNKTRTDATQIMLHVHTRGVGVCGVYTHEVAETKVHLVLDKAREDGHPLMCTMEPE